MTRLKEALIVFFHRIFGESPLYPISEEWDAILNKLMDTYEPSKIGDHTCYFGDTEVWISNYPYAFGKLGFYDYLPKYPTMRRLKKILEKHQHQKNYKTYLEFSEKLQGIKRAEFNDT